MKKLVLYVFLLAGVFSALLSCRQNKKPGTKEIVFGKNKIAGKFLDIRGIKMYYEEYGEGEPLLMIHGNGGSISSFKNNIPFFSQSYHVIATDSRAQGKSTDAQDSLSFEMMADDEAALLDALHIDSAYIIGWSDGGIVALEMAMRHPDKVTKIAISGANLWPDSTAIQPESWIQSQQYFDNHRDSIWKSDKEKNEWKLFRLDWDLPNISLLSLKSIKCPSLIIAGEKDIILKKHTEIIAGSIPQSKLWIVPNSGHATLIDYKEEFNKKVHEFFTTHFPDIK
jgi:pimeloyl-ACP methyl ester carboxylesterase